MSKINKDRLNYYFYLFLIGILTTIAFAPTYIFFIFFFSFKYLLDRICLNCENNKLKAFKTGWMFGFGYFIGNCYWYCNSLLIEPKTYGWLIPFAITFIPAYLALYTGLTTLSINYSMKYTKNRFILSILFSTFWTIFEYLRGILFTGFPWNIIAYSLGFSPIIIQTVSIFGSYIFGFFILIIYTSYWVLQKKEYNKYSILYLLMILSNFIYGYIRLSNIDNSKFSKFKIRIVQPNIRQEIKINKNNREEILDKLITLSSKNSENISYIIWPETAMPYGIFINKSDLGNKEINIDFLNNKTLIIGAIRIDRNNKKIFNSIIFVKNGKIIDYYDKKHLVPFGEYIPLRNILPKFLNSIIGDIDISKSKENIKTIFVDENLYDISPIICYEAIFNNLINKKTRLIINVTNDAWFGKTSGPYQHFETLKFRALENNATVVRVANSGISGLIDRFGRTIIKTKLGTDDVLDILLPEY